MTPGQPRATGVTFQVPDSIGTESFAVPSPSESMLGRTTATPSRSRGSPRNGRHSVHRVCVSPRRPAVRGRGKTRARDVWTFFKEVDGRRECLFCQ